MLTFLGKRASLTLDGMQEIRDYDCLYITSREPSLVVFRISNAYYIFCRTPSSEGTCPLMLSLLCTANSLQALLTIISPLRNSPRSTPLSYRLARLFLSPSGCLVRLMPCRDHMKEREPIQDLAHRLWHLQVYSSNHDDTACMEQSLHSHVRYETRLFLVVIRSLLTPDYIS